jgi:two-component system cell cycle response regulator
MADDRRKGQAVLAPQHALSSGVGEAMTPAVSDRPTGMERDTAGRAQVITRLREELQAARTQLEQAEAEIRRLRHEAENRRKLVEILSDVSSDLSADELTGVMVRRVARALNVSRCSIVIGRASDSEGVVVVAYENPTLRGLSIELAKYPEIRASLNQGAPVLVEDIWTSELYAQVRGDWAALGTDVRLRSTLAIPFTLEPRQTGVFFLRTGPHESPLTREDQEFAQIVVATAATAIRRARVVDGTRAENVRLEALSRTDPLTAVENRRALMERLRAELERTQRYEGTLSVLMIDIDHFKQVNDSVGHMMGDEVLRRVAAVLQREARGADAVARFGGEEFVVVLPATTSEGAVTFAERVRAKIAAEPPLGGADYGWLRISVSIGVATTTDGAVIAPDELIALADEALYRAKSDGRNRVSM